VSQIEALRAEIADLKWQRDGAVDQAAALLVERDDLRAEVDMHRLLLVPCLRLCVIAWLREESEERYCAGWYGGIVDVCRRIAENGGAPKEIVEAVKIVGWPYDDGSWPEEPVREWLRRAQETGQEAGKAQG
jgi:hypothetical protein